MSTALGCMTAAKPCKYFHVMASKYNSQGQAVYMTAALGVIHDLDTGSQLVYGGKQQPMIQKSLGDQLSCHRDDILTLALSKDRTKVVTGQIGKYPSVHIWDALTSE